MSRPLDGVRVLDLSQVVSGPICGRVLADLGADVVKVEPPGGDIIRFARAHRWATTPLSVYFTWANAGKRSICVDLRTERGAALVRELAESSDVVLENFRPGVLEKFGLDADVAPARAAELIYCSINGWGFDNSWSQRRAYAAMVQAEVGRVELDARLRNAPPEQSPHVDGDITPGLLAVSGILAALFQRERTGVGQHLDVSMAEALVYTDEWTSTELAGFDGDRASPTRGTTRSSRSPTAPTSRSWATRTGASPRSPPRSPTHPCPSLHVTRRGAAVPRRPLRAGSRLRHARGALRRVRLPRGRGPHRAAAGGDAMGARAGGVRGGGTGRAGRRRAVPFGRSDHRRARRRTTLGRAHPKRARGAVRPEQRKTSSNSPPTA